MTIETRYSAIETALKLSNSQTSTKDLITRAAIIEEWLDGSSPSEIRFQDLQTSLHRLEDKLYERNAEEQHKRRIEHDASSTGWFVGIIVALAILAIGYLVFRANETSTLVTAITPAVQL